MGWDQYEGSLVGSFVEEGIAAEDDIAAAGEGSSEEEEGTAAVVVVVVEEGIAPDIVAEDNMACSAVGEGRHMDCIDYSLGLGTFPAHHLLRC